MVDRLEIPSTQQVSQFLGVNGVILLALLGDQVIPTRFADDELVNQGGQVAPASAPESSSGLASNGSIGRSS